MGLVWLLLCSCITLLFLFPLSTLGVFLTIQTTRSCVSSLEHIKAFGKANLNTKCTHKTDVPGS